MPKKRLSAAGAIVVVCALWSSPVFAAAQHPAVFGIPVDFILFALTLIGVALFHRHTLAVAIAGLATITLYKLLVTGFKTGPGLAGLGLHLAHESVILINLFLLLLGFALLSRHFEDSRAPHELPRLLPHGWRGSFVLLVVIFVLSSFLDNIAAALIGGTIAAGVYRGKVHLGFLAAIVAASNAGGSGSVVGDTTTTMMWISGVGPLEVVHAYVAAAVALVVCGIPASLQQERLAPMHRPSEGSEPVDWTRVGIVAMILVTAIATNVYINSRWSEISDKFPFLGAAVWVVLLVAAPLRQPHWPSLPQALKGTLFLLALVTAASMMPVETLPAAAWHTAFGLGVVSAVFDNIPLTALALNQGGYDWGVLAYAVGFGGSMIWFGSSTGVALSNNFPEAKSVFAWLRHGWHVSVAYIVGFFVLLLLVGWHPGNPNEMRIDTAAKHAVHQ
jgi:Na+/H+ antiporter NhaD/arsenite permease-like protein